VPMRLGEGDASELAAAPLKLTPSPKPNARAPRDISARRVIFKV
jgi:hypothetical protein